MTITTRHTGYFLFMTALLLKTVFSEGSHYQSSYSVGDASVTTATTTGDTGVAFEHPVRNILAPDMRWLDGFDLRSETEWLSNVPLTIQLGKDNDKKVSSLPLQNALRRLGEVIKSRGLLTDHTLRSPSTQRESWFLYLQPTLKYIFQDTYQSIEQRTDRKIFTVGQWVSLYDNDIYHSFGDVWSMVQPSSNIAREVGIFVTYLDQGIYLLIHEHGFKFLDLAGFRKLVMETLNQWYTWESSKLAPIPLTWSQWFYRMHGYLPLPSANNIFNWFSDPFMNTVILSSFIGLYAIKQIYSSLTDIDMASANRGPRPDGDERLSETRDDRNTESGPDFSKSGCEAACHAHRCQTDLNAGQEQCSQDQRVHDEALRSETLAKLIIVGEDRVKAKELGQKEHPFVLERVERLLHNHLRLDWTMEELIRALVYENRNKKLLEKLQWAFSGTVSVSNKLMRLKKALDETR